MKVPKQTKSHVRFYVATSTEEAFSSWGASKDAFLSWSRLRVYEPHNAVKVLGVLMVSPAGQQWVEDGVQRWKKS